MIHYKGLQRCYINQIRSGEKRVEVRINDANNSLISEGDYIFFEREIRVLVLRVEKYKTIDELFNSIDVNKALPGKSVSEAKAIYEKLYKDRAKDLLEYGMTAIHIEVT